MANLVVVDETFNQWLAEAEKVMLVCHWRKYGHIWPDVDDKRVTYGQGRRTGLMLEVAPCLRGCGLVRTTYLATKYQLEAAGIKNPSNYDYTDKRYLIKSDPEARLASDNIGRDHRDAIIETVQSLIPKGRIEVIDD